MQNWHRVATELVLLLVLIGKATVVKKAKAS